MQNQTEVALIGTEHTKIQGIQQYNNEYLMTRFINYLIQTVLQGQSAVVTAIGVHGSNKTQQLFGKNQMIEQFAKSLLKRATHYTVAASLFELQNNMVIDHLAPEDNFQSHFRQPSILSCRVASQNDISSLFSHMRQLSQNFDGEVPLQSSSNAFCRILCYNIHSKVLSTVLFCDVVGDEENYQQFLGQFCNFTQNSSLQYGNLENQTPLVQFLIPIFKVSKAFFLGFLNENQNELQQNVLFLQQIKEVKTKQITIKMDITDLKIISIDDVGCEMESNSQMHHSGVGKSKDLYESHPVVDLERNALIQQKVEQSIQENNEYNVKSLVFEGVDLNQSSKLTKSQIKEELSQKESIVKENVQNNRKKMNLNLKTSEQNRNYINASVIKQNTQNAIKEQLQQEQQEEPKYSTTVQTQIYQPEYIFDYNADKLIEQIEEKQEEELNEIHQQTTESQVTVNLNNSQDLTRSKLTPVLEKLNQQSQVNKQSQLKQAILQLKQTETIRNELEQKLRNVESHTAELTLKIQLHQLNNSKRIKNAEIISAQIQQTENLEFNKQQLSDYQKNCVNIIQNEENQLNRLSEQLIQQILDNQQVLQSKVSKYLNGNNENNEKLSSAQSNIIKQHLNTLNCFVQERICKERDNQLLGKSQREYLLKTLLNNQQQQVLQDQIVIMCEKENDTEKYDQQIQQLQQELDQINIQVKEKEHLLSKKKYQINQLNSDFIQFRVFRQLLGENEFNIDQLAVQGRNCLNYINQLSQQRILTNDEIRVRNQVIKILELAQQQDTNGKNEKQLDIKGKFNGINQQLVDYEHEIEDKLIDLLEMHKTE